jgi:rare lipoprotein A
LIHRKPGEPRAASLIENASPREEVSMSVHAYLLAPLTGALMLLLAQAGHARGDSATEATTQTGVASYYGPQFNGRPMADGTPFDPESDVAASRTLPLGTWVRVTNLENGRSEVVQIRDRGPYIDGRIIDLSPRTARRLDMIEQGLAKVEVVPLTEDERQLAQTEAAQTSGE